MNEEKPDNQTIVSYYLETINDVMNSDKGLIYSTIITVIFVMVLNILLALCVVLQQAFMAWIVMFLQVVLLVMTTFDLAKLMYKKRDSDAKIMDKPQGISTCDA